MELDRENRPSMTENAEAVCARCHAPIIPPARFCGSCGATVPVFRPGQIIDDRYEVIELVAEGGMSEVYKVRHLHLDEIRMVKIMRGGVLAEEGQQLRFQHEAKLARMVRHANVATLHDFSRLDDGSFYMVWEYLDGQTVQNWAASNRQMTCLEAIDVAIQVLDGLQAIHDAGIVHRDISPDNIMVVSEKSRDGKNERLMAKIIDLGIAKSLDVELTSPRRTETGTFIGKAKYASPEQAGLLRKGEAIDPRSDVYSLGVTLYEMLTGTVPFESSTLEGYLLKHLRETPPPMRKAAPHLALPRSLEDVVSRAMEKERDHRFPTATAFREALVAARAHVVTSSEPKKPSRFKLPTLSVAVPHGPQDMTTERTGVPAKVGDAGTIAASLPPRPEGERSAERALENMLPGESGSGAQRLPIFILVAVVILAAAALAFWKFKPASGARSETNRAATRREPLRAPEPREAATLSSIPVSNTPVSEAGMPANVEGGLIPATSERPAPTVDASTPASTVREEKPASSTPPRPEAALKVSEGEATEILRNWIVSRKFYPADSACIQVRSLGFKNAGYTAEAVSGGCNPATPSGSVVGKWRIDAATGEVFVQNARGRYVSP